MGKKLVMTIEEAVSRWLEMSEGSVLVAKPPLTWGAEAMFVELTDDYRVPQPVQDEGYEYLLGREDIANLVDFLNGKRVSGRTSAEFVIHYAMNDSAPAWIDDIPSE